MKLFDKLFGKEEIQEAVVVPESPQVFTIPQNTKERQGMWVVVEQGVGILTGDTEVTLVKPDGTTLMTIEDDKAVASKIVVSEVTQAFIEDIPESRRPDLGMLYSLGYKHKEIV